MLTIDEIRDITFRKGRGYKDEDVDAFIDEVIVTFEQMKKDKKDLVRKMDILATKIEQYRADEETVRNALFNAQKTADTIINEANAKASKIVTEAEDKAQKMLKNANKITSDQKDIYLKLKADSVKLRNDLESVYKKHLKGIDDLPTDAVLIQEKAQLDNKYPTEPVAEPVEEAKPVQPVVEEKEPEPTEPETSVIEDVVSSSQSVEFVKPDDSPKFSDLKFGDNYDVEDE
jgi:cell division initiation protein